MANSLDKLSLAFILNPSSPEKERRLRSEMLGAPAEFPSEEDDAVAGVVALAADTRVKKGKRKRSGPSLKGAKRRDGKRPACRRITPQQLHGLENAFAEDPMPDTAAKLVISNRLGLSPEQVKIWFQNKRARLRRIERALHPHQETPTGIIFHFFQGTEFLP